MQTTHISFKAPPSLWEAFKAQTDALFLSRSPFLNHVLVPELEHVRNDLHGCQLSLKARRRISGELKRAGAKSVNIEVASSMAEELKAVVAQHKLVRDALICRLIVFLRSSDALLKYLEIPQHSSGQLEWGLEDMPTSPLKAMEVVRDDPLFYIRHHLQRQRGVGVYRVALPRKFDWAACYLDDTEVPGTAAFDRLTRSMDEVFGTFETKALSTKPKLSRGRIR